PLVVGADGRGDVTVEVLADLLSLRLARVAILALRVARLARGLLGWTSRHLVKDRRESWVRGAARPRMKPSGVHGLPRASAIRPSPRVVDGRLYRLDHPLGRRRIRVRPDRLRVRRPKLAGRRLSKCCRDRADVIAGHDLASRV